MKFETEENTWGIYTQNLFSMLKMCLIFFMVLLNIIRMENFSYVDSKGHIAKYEIYSDIVNSKYIDTEKVSILKQREGVQAVYCQRLCTEIICNPNQKNKYHTNMNIFNNSLMEKMMELNKITGLDVKNDKIAIVVSFDDKKYQCSTMTLKYSTGKSSSVKTTTVFVNKILYNADQSSLLGGSVFSTSEHADLIVNEKLAKEIASKLGDENLLNNYTDILVDCNSLIEKNVLNMLFDEVTILDVESNSNDNERFLQTMKTSIKWILVMVVLVCIFIIRNIVHKNIALDEEETGVQKKAGEIKDTGKELMRTTGKTFLQACKVAVPVSLAVNFFFRFNKFKLVVTGYWAGALVVFGVFFILTSIAVKRTVHKLKK